MASLESPTTELKDQEEGPISGYLRLSRTWTYSLIFVFPLMVIYQLIILATNATGEVRVINGAHAFLAWILGFAGIGPYFGFFFVATLVVIAGILWDRRRGMREIKAAYFVGMFVESVVYATVFGTIVMTITSAILPFSLINEIALGIGAGVYEEVVFRVFLISGVIKLYREIGGDPSLMSYALVIAVSSVIFSAAHITGDPNALDPFVFTYRAVGGVVFAILYLARGFGIAVYTHALYDVFVVLSL
ncbi:MAG: CPBP family intramembrane glutamic endopeptidase [Halobacteria archaeon]|nr:CPBP family intramembrane glutamic endopeptidase [Halobacteria archaeon]